MITTDKIEKAKQEIKKSSKKPIIVLAHDDKFNRKILEYGKLDILLDIETGNRKSKLRQEDSGLNHVLAKIASKNNVAIGIDLNKIKKKTKEGKARTLSKIIQNIKICRKSNTRMAIINSTSKNEERSFLLSLGASTEQAKGTASFFN